MNRPPSRSLAASRLSLLVSALACCMAPVSAEPLAASLPDLLKRESASTDSTPFQGTDNWRFLRSELRHLTVISAPDFAFKPTVNPVPAISEFHKALAARSIKLVLVPIPEKARIRCDKLTAGTDAAAAGAALDKAAAAVYDKLKKEGVEVLDLTSVFRAEVQKGGDPGYCRTDSHFSPHLCEITAGELAKVCRAALPDLPKPAAGAWTTEDATIKITGDLAAKDDSESLQYRKVGKAGSPGPIEPADHSPVLLLGDSHCLIFHAGGDMLASGTGLSDHLAAALGVAPAVIGVRGGGATAARVNLFRKASKDKTFLPSVKVVLWCLAARDLTQAEEWKTVPLPK